MNRDNCRLNVEIERYIEQWDGTIHGMEVRNMYDGGANYESICERIGIDYEDYKEEWII